MCDECWKEFRGWCKSFTVTEALLAALEAALLVACVGVLVFLVGHFIACGGAQPCEPAPTPAPPGSTDLPPPPGGPTDSPPQPSGPTDPPAPPGGPTDPPPHEHGDAAPDEPPPKHTTLSPDVQCTWKPSAKTAASARYYEGGRSERPETEPPPVELAGALDDISGLALADQSDGAPPPPGRPLVLALARRRLLACPLTALTELWALTAASCLDALEETDTLDQYRMVERWGSEHERSHAVTDVRVHPRYSQPARGAYDAAALRSPDPLLRGAAPPRLPSMADYFLITIGERFTILGFGPFRSLDSGSNELREVAVYSLNPLQCSAAASGAEEGWAARHLSGGAPLVLAAPGAAPLCAGVLYARGAPCGYCAGSPLLRGRTLLGIGAAAAPCAESCEPRPYVNLALIRDWIDELRFL